MNRRKRIWVAGVYFESGIFPFSVIGQILLGSVSAISRTDDKHFSVIKTLSQILSICWILWKPVLDSDIMDSDLAIFLFLEFCAYNRRRGVPVHLKASSEPLLLQIYP